MKRWTIALSALLALVLLVSMADAKGKRSNVGSGDAPGGIEGKVASITSSGFYITVGGRNNRHNLQVVVTKETTIHNASGGDAKIDQDLVNKHVSVAGKREKVAGTDSVTATSVTIGGHKHKKKRPSSPSTNAAP